MKAFRVVAMLFGVAITFPAHAQTFPSKPVRFIIPFPPGGSTDIVGRMVADTLTKSWGISVFPDNRSSAGGNAGTEQCAKSLPDGYTICMLTVAQSIAPSVYSKVNFDPIKDFSHVTLVATLPSLLMVHPSLPVKNVRELIALAKSKPGVLNYASSGNGTSAHMLTEMFKQYAEINLLHVPYKGGGPAVIAQISGEVEIGFSTAIASLPYMRRDKLRALAVSTKERFPPIPEVPTIDESGLKGFDGGSWSGVVLPIGASRDIVHRVHSDLAKMLKSPDHRETILKMGAIASGNTPEEFAAFIRVETAKWAKVSKAAKVSVD